ncbi:MAG: M20 family metallo-hydrolase [Pyramidobacter sp.]|jgi:allantoate deiminase
MIDVEKSRSRIAEDLATMMQYTATPGNGCTRLPFTKEALEGMQALRRMMSDAGLTVKTDEAGNLFGFLIGSHPELPCVMMGSHYDSVLQGGDYDGIAGVIAGIEVARILMESGEVFPHTFVVAAFNDEEGMRFGTGYFGSGAMLGLRDVNYCKQYKDKDGISIYTAMQHAGLDPEKIGQTAWPKDSIAHFMELHIEQGPVLDREGLEIGLVDCIVGIKRYIATVHGQADHAGTTPMDMRRDAVEAATKVISKIPDWAREKDDGTVATVGYVKTVPGGMNIVAERCDFTIDVRSRHKENLVDISEKIKAALEKESAAIGGSFELVHKLDVQPVELSKDLLGILEGAAKEYGYSYRYLPSGAGHDSLEIAPHIPTVMLFVPSRDGRSHCPEEFTDSLYFAKGVALMTRLAQEKLRRSR